MKPRRRLVAFALGGSFALVAAFALGWWLARPPLPEEPRFLALDLPEVRLWARSDQAAARGLELRLLGPLLEMWLESDGVLGPVLFQLRGRGAAVEVRSGRAAATFEPPSSGRPFFFEWQPQQARRDRARSGLFYRLILSFPDLEQGSTAGEETPTVAFLGTRELLDRDLYAVDWTGCGAPQAVAEGEELLALAHLRNASPHPWPHAGNARVRLSYRWLDAAGAPIVHDAPGTDLTAPLEPGAELARWLRVRAPDEPGRYLLELDPRFTPLAWFSEKGAATCRAEVEVR